MEVVLKLKALKAVAYKESHVQKVCLVMLAVLKFQYHTVSPT